MAKIIPITEHYQQFLAEMKESFWGELARDSEDRHMGHFFRQASQREYILDGGIKVIYRFDLFSGARVIPRQFGHQYHGQRLINCWPSTATDIKYVRELYRHDTREILIRDPSLEWQSKWATWGILPPFTYEEIRDPRLALSRLYARWDDTIRILRLLRIWQEKVEPRYISDPRYYPEDWQWRRLWMYYHHRGQCCMCKTPLVSPLKRSSWGYTP
jgi:hypothetical protein